MYATLYVRLEGFCACACHGRKPEAAGRPLVVTHEGRVLDADHGARAKGVLPGRSLSEAKCLMGGEGLVVPFVAQEYAEDQAQWLDLCVASSHAVEPLSPHSALVDLSRHPDPRRTGDELLARLAPSAPEGLWAGLGEGGWHAQLAASGVDAAALALGLPVLEPALPPAALLARTPVVAMTPLPPEVVERVARLGYKQVGQLATAPYRVLQSQFGSLASKVQAMAQGHYRPLARPLYPPESLEVALPFEGAVQDRTVLDQAVQSLARQCAQTLAARGKVAEGAWLVFDQEEGPPCSVRRQFARPLGQPGPLSAAFNQMVGQVMNEGFVPRSVRALLTHLRPTPFVQRLLVEGSDRQEQALKARLVVQATQASFGTGAVMAGSEVKPTRREQVMREWKRATGWQ